MIGWGFNYCIVLDNDNKGRRTQERLQQDFKSTDIKLIYVSETKDKEIEDLFTREDFAQHILGRRYQCSWIFLIAHGVDGIFLFTMLLLVVAVLGP